MTPPRRLPLENIIVPLLIAAIVGGVEMRVRVGQLQSSHEDAMRRLDRIERLVDTHTFASKD